MKEIEPIYRVVDLMSEYDLNKVEQQRVNKRVCHHVVKYSYAVSRQNGNR
jgi:hypothetical protein